MIYVFSKAGAFYERKDITGDFKAVGGGCKPSKVYGGAVGEQGLPTNEGKRCALSVIDVANSARKGNHPTEKPESLYRFLIERYCPVGGTVLDPTFGSGNSVFQAFAMGRSAIGIEKDEKFYKKAEERLNALP
jgi:site-specific DNA-methyltransferase (adenine-specific)